MRRQPPHVVVDPSAWEDAVQTASRQSGTETGGILWGCRHSAGVYVAELIEVPDPDATCTSYVRSSETAARELESRIRGLPEESLDGYVGEWHTHLERQGPSRTDRSEINQISKNSGGEVALIVIALDPRSSLWAPEGLCARSGRTRRAAVEVRTGGEPSTGPVASGEQR